MPANRHFPPATSFVRDVVEWRLFDLHRIPAHRSGIWTLVLTLDDGQHILVEMLGTMSGSAIASAAAIRASTWGRTVVGHLRVGVADPAALVDRRRPPGTRSAA